ncbi:MAG: ABC transporter ATP-binding protein, partial [Fimbriimonadaceae bacterium]
MTPAISVRGLGKAYTIAHQEKATLASEALMAKLRNPFGRVSRETFWALRDVEFDIEKGDVVGIIGRNGAGKSTLLKVLSRITTPTTGEVRLYGRVGSLLEVGTGFHPELTGRENIYLNGAILGMRRSEIDRQFDAIVDFAEVEKFLDTPVKRYSSGMYVRLAFAVAAHLNPEILIVDEVLAVGDAKFQAKCLGKMQDVSRQEGRTVLFVSHNMLSVQALCRTGILLKEGNVVDLGRIGPVVERYLTEYAHRIDTFPPTVSAEGSFCLKDFGYEGERPGALPVSGKKMTFIFDVEGTVRPGAEFEVGIKSTYGSY